MKFRIEMTAEGNLKIHLPIVLRCHAGKKRIVSVDEETDTSLRILIARARSWQKAIDNGRFASSRELANTLGIEESRVSRTLRLNRLSPKIVHMIICGDYPSKLNIVELRKGIPPDWSEQEKLYLN